MKTEQGFNYTGSSTYNFNNVELSPDGIALFDAITGFGGVDYMPYDGSTVLVKTGVFRDGVHNLYPSLNNKIYYLVSDIEYGPEDKATIISLATEVTIAFSVDHYEGTFVFNNPNDYEYLYLIWDYTNTMDGGSASFTGKEVTKYIEADFGSDIGSASIDHVTDAYPSRFIIEWNDLRVADTGYIGLNSQATYDALIAKGIAPGDIKLQTPLDGLVNNGTGTLSFNKFTDSAIATVIVHSPLNVNTTWSITKNNPSLTSFYLDEANGTLANVCSQTAATEYFHDGIGTLPEAGDRVYADSIGSALFDGGNSYHIIDTTVQAGPPVSGGLFAAIDTEGLVYARSECDCTEVAIPVIDQDTIEVIMGEYVDIILNASNNPTSWTVDSNCERYTLTGGTKGSIFSAVECNGVTRNVTVNARATVSICVTALPVLLFGDGTLTADGYCLENDIPRGMSFDTTTGRLYGKPEEACSFSFDVLATNCFGNSLVDTINIEVATGIYMTPFPIDVENFSTSGAAACLLTAVYSLLYHDGVGNLPVENDTIFLDHKGLERFNGGGRWYKIDGSTISVKICETGKVCDQHTC